MKFFIAVLSVCLFAFATAELDYEAAAKYVEACYKEIGLVEGFEGELTDRQNKCGIACTYKALGLFNEDATLNIRNILAIKNDADVEELHQHILDCNAEIGEVSKEDYICELAACFHKNNHFASLD